MVSNMKKRIAPLLTLALVSISSCAVFGATPFTKLMRLETATTEYTLGFNDTMNSKSGAITHQKPYSGSGSAIWVAEDVKPESGNFYFGTQYFSGQFTSVVNRGKKTSYEGRTYYQINNSENIDAYVAIEQEIYNNDTDRNGTYSLPYDAIENVSYTTMTYNCSRKGCTSYCFISSSSTNDSVSCTNNSATLTQGSTVSGRSGTIYFYLPRIPTKQLVFNNVLIAYTKEASAISTVDLYAAKDMAEQEVKRGGGYTVFNFRLNATLTFNNTCSVGSAAVAEIPLDALSPDSFTTKEGKPAGYTPKRTDLVFSCEKSIADTFTGINWTMTPTADSDGSGLPGVLRAKAKGSNTVNGLGIKVTKDSGGSTAVNFGTANSATISGNKATATFWAYPTMTSDTKPSGGGDFIATATVTFEVP